MTLWEQALDHARKLRQQIGGNASWDVDLETIARFWLLAKAEAMREAAPRLKAHADSPGVIECATAFYQAAKWADKRAAEYETVAKEGGGK